MMTFDCLKIPPGNGDMTDDCISKNGVDLRRNGICDPLDWGTAWQMEDTYEMAS